VSNKLLSITVRDRNRTWSFEFYADPQYLAEWRADGLEIAEVCNVIPEWVPAPLIKPWCYLQDLFNFKNPWSKK